jgi:isopentenyldiphosphate isomerase
MTKYYYFMIQGFPKPFGYVHSSIIPKVSWGEDWKIDEERRILTFNGGETFTERCQRMEKTLRANPKEDDASAFGRWCDERFPVYDAEGEHVLDLDGAGVDAFGIVNYACHLIAYVMTKDGMKYWVPRRAKTKRSFPDMLDNTVGGSLSSGEKPIDCIVRECAEEASLPVEYTRANITACGVLSYQMTQTDYGQEGCQHQVQYLYEMEMSKDVVLVPNDGEAQEFNLMSLEEVITALRTGQFKLNCAMTWMAFLIRHGHVNAENEPKLTEITSRLHRKHDLFIV